MEATTVIENVLTDKVIQPKLLPGTEPIWCKKKVSDKGRIRNVSKASSTLQNWPRTETWKQKFIASRQEWLAWRWNDWLKDDLKQLNDTSEDKLNIWKTSWMGHGIRQRRKWTKLVFLKNLTRFRLMKTSSLKQNWPALGKGKNYF